MSESGRAADWPMWSVWLALAAYVLAFAAFYPTVLTVSDEAAYMRQAAAFAQGRLTVTRPDALGGETREDMPSDYPPGTSLFMAPLMALGGWRAGFLLGALSLCIGVLALALLLRREGRSPLFALLFMAYPPALVISRCGMSDLPTAALVACGLYFFWRGGLWRLAAGFLAGASLLFRETAPLLFVFFFAGALLRRERGVPWLVLGGLAGCALRPLAAWLVFGDPWFVKPSYPGFSMGALAQNAALYAGALLAFVPLGALWVALYRGPRRAELIGTAAAFVALHLFYNYSAEQSGGLKQWVLVPRFFIPLLPVLVLATAEAVPRLWNGWLARLGVEARVSLLRAARFAAALLVAGVCAELSLVGLKHAQWSAEQRGIVVALYSGTEGNVPLLVNADAAGKFVNELYDSEFGARRAGDFNAVSDAQLRQAVADHGRVQLALLYRGDSEFWRARRSELERRVAALAKEFDVMAEAPSRPGSGEELHILTLTARHQRP